MTVDVTTDAATPSNVVVPSDEKPPDDPAALLEAVKWLSEVVKNEETRFNNLNNRAIAVLTTSSLVTALAGLFAKDLVGTTFDDSNGRPLGLLGIGLTAAALFMGAWKVVRGVLLPSPRLVFGDNAVTGPKDSTVPRPADKLTVVEIQTIVFADYRKIYRCLVQRNTEKAKKLNSAYNFYLAAVFLICLTTVVLVIASR